MNSKNFTTELVNKIVDTFPKLKCYYEFDDLFNTHYLTIEPKSEFEQNEKLNIMLDDIYFDFIERYPKESIAFSKNDAIANLANSFYVGTGAKFECLRSNLWSLNQVQIKTKFEIDSSDDDEFYIEDEFSNAA